MAGAVSEPAHAAAVGEVKRATQRRSGVGAAIRAAQRGAEVDERAGVLEPVRTVRQQGGGTFEQGDPLGR